MGWRVYVRNAIISIATCNEMGCTWDGTPTFIQDDARKEAEAHRQWHAEEWRKMNEEWEARNG